MAKDRKYIFFCSNELRSRWVSVKMKSQWEYRNLMAYHKFDICIFKMWKTLHSYKWKAVTRLVWLLKCFKFCTVLVFYGSPIHFSPVNNLQKNNFSLYCIASLSVSGMTAYFVFPCPYLSCCKPFFLHRIKTKGEAHTSILSHESNGHHVNMCCCSM